VAIVLGAKDNLIIILLLLKIALARHKWWAGRSGVARGGPLLISGQRNL
jgi:hypothetical protein